MAGRRMNLLLMPEEGGRIRQFRIRLWPVYAAIGVAILLVAFLLGSGAAYLQLVRSERAGAILFQENEALRAELVELGGRINGLDTTVRSHIRLANDSRLLAGLPPYGEELALLGVGGMAATTGGFSQEGLSPAVGRTIGFYQDRLDQLSRQLSFQQESFVEVRDLIEANRERLDHIPTINPVMASHYFSSGFGPRRDPFTGRRAHHNGLDICAESGTPFCATADGVVTMAGKNGRLGNTVKVDHGNEYVTVYGHAETVRVKKGQEVHRGDVLGEVGNTGRSTGVHLHYEVRKGSRPVNPWPYILDNDR